MFLRSIPEMALSLRGLSIPRQGKSRCRKIQMAAEAEARCPVCAETFAALAAHSPEQRQTHAEQCVEDSERDPMLRRVYRCPVCDEDLAAAGLAKRVQHVKSCAKVAGIKRPRQLRARLVPNENLIDELLSAHRKLVELPRKSKITGYFVERDAEPNDN